jgi:hypothetical protein
LHRARAVSPIIIQPNFPHRDHFGPGGQLAQLGQRVLVKVGGVVGMEADAGKQAGVLLGHCNDLTAILQICGRIDKSRHPGLGGAGDDLRQIVLKGVKYQMAMGIDQHQIPASSRPAASNSATRSPWVVSQ